MAEKGRAAREKVRGCTWAVVVAGGSGSRFGARVPKQFVQIRGKPLLHWTLDALWGAYDWDGMVVVLPRGWTERRWLPERMSRLENVLLAEGGSRRRDSVKAGLEKVPAEAEYVLIHDGARPRVGEELVRKVLEGTLRWGACVPVLAVDQTVKRVGANGMVSETLDRGSLRLVQTPQGFRRAVLVDAFDKAGGDDFTDDAAVVEAAGHPVGCVEGDPANRKVTTPADLADVFPPVPRVGFGYDVHRLEQPGKKLVLCGVEIDHPVGPVAHSDGDVALHALMDAILGAAGLGDIGRLFPDTDPRYEGASSVDMLKNVLELVGKQGMMLSSADVTIVAQRPRLGDKLYEMAERMAEVCGIARGRIGVKATTEEGLGVTGGGGAIAAHAVAVLVEG